MAETEIKSIQWFPGHMAKTRRSIKENLSLVDAVVEIIDARIPLSSQNPEMGRMTAGKPRLLVLNKRDMADNNITDRWISYFRKKGIAAVSMDCKSGKGLKAFTSALENQVLKDLIETRKAKGMVGAPLRVMVVGIPNVGKSSFINRMSGSKKAKVEDRPGVTRTKQWVKLGDRIEMLDMPGVLWPKFDDQLVARKLAFTGAIRDDILDIETLAMLLLEYLAENYPACLKERYKMDSEGLDGKELLELLGRKRGMLISGGEVNTERAAIMLLDEFRAGKTGCISLEKPEE
ncbi:MAG: ribosome biogenesis GTPase YlqF [Oscillospiraceae bacterium]|nr:ribosome biogenesis GTPase YlqF [Oscillospiraceae bacterium]MDD6082149.1 ribosome biogenesis GTPase YlqF [Oscillospiraceae bacterium]